MNYTSIYRTVCISVGGRTFNRSFHTTRSISRWNHVPGTAQAYLRSIISWLLRCEWVVDVLSSPSASQPSLSSVGQYFLMQQQPTSTSCERSYRFPIVFPFSIRFIISTAGDSGPIDVVYYRGSRPRVDTLHHHGQRDKKNAVDMGMTQRRLPCFSLGRGCLKKLYLFYLGVVSRNL
jgi:hypothetical protein